MVVGEGSVGVTGASERMFGDLVSEAGSGGGLATAACADSQIPNCPNGCTSGKVYRDGVRYGVDGRGVQRWLCTCCGFRFSDKPLKSEGALTISRQICALGAKNLTAATELKTVAGDKKKSGFPFAVVRNIDLVAEEPRGLLTQFMAYLEREGYCADIQYPATLARLVKDAPGLLDAGAKFDLLEPESVKTVIARMKKLNGEPWSDSMKMLATCAYDTFCRMKKISWERPVYTQNEATVYLADEKELDLLISAAPRKKMATFLKCLKETFADPSEVICCDWVDWKGNVLSINHPVKGHYPGKYELTPELAAMINSLPRKNKRIFATNYDNLYNSFVKLRARAADKFQNPALLQITFKSFRHWGGTMLAYKTNGNVPVMARVLRHKNWKSTQKYVHLVESLFKEEDFDTTVATTAQEILALGKDGWQKYDEANFGGVQMHFYRKGKKFGGFENMVDKSKKADDTLIFPA